MPEKYTKRPDGSVGSIPHDIIVTFNYDILANAVDTWLFYADTTYEVVGVKCVPRVAGSDGSAVTAAVKKASGTTAPASGTTVMASTFNLKGTADTLQTDTLTTTIADRRLAAGDRLGVDFTGTLTAAVGLIQVNLKRVQSTGSF